jgi:peptide-methionine (R)-S-oxide reductase
MKKIKKSAEEWRKILTPEEYRILREAGTEKPFSGEYVANKSKGKYLCRACGLELFGSETKFDSGTGWPSFWSPSSKDNIETKPDYKLVAPRNEVLCSRCGGHLGHVFEDGPKPTGKRYCINSAALSFRDEKKKK